jgi:hypothetical protein
VRRLLASFETGQLLMSYEKNAMKGHEFISWYITEKERVLALLCDTMLMAVQRRNAAKSKYINTSPRLRIIHHI